MQSRISGIFAAYVLSTSTFILAIDSSSAQFIGLAKQLPHSTAQELKSTLMTTGLNRSVGCIASEVIHPVDLRCGQIGQRVNYLLNCKPISCTAPQSNQSIGASIFLKLVG